MKYASLIFFVILTALFFCSCNEVEADADNPVEKPSVECTPVTEDDVSVEIFGYVGDDGCVDRMEITVLNKKLVAECDGYWFKETAPRIYVDDITGDGIEDVAIVISSARKKDGNTKYSEHIYIIDCKDGACGIFESAGECGCDFRTVGNSETIFINTPLGSSETLLDEEKMGTEINSRYDVKDGKIIRSRTVMINNEFVWGSDVRTIMYRDGTLTVESSEYKKLADRTEVLSLKDEKTGNIVSFEVGVLATWGRESTDAFDTVFKEIVEEGNTRRNTGYAFKGKDFYGVPFNFVFDGNVCEITNNGMKNPGIMPADNCVIKLGNTDSGLDYCIYYEKHNESIGKEGTFEARKAGETTAYAFVRVSPKNVILLEYILDESTLDLAEQSVKQVSLVGETKEWTNYRVHDTVIMKDKNFTVDSYRVDNLVTERADVMQVTFNIGIAEERNYSYCVNGVYKVNQDFVLDGNVTDVVPLPFLKIDGTEKLFRNVTSDGREYYMTYHSYEYLQSDGTHRDFISCIYIMLSDEYLLQLTYISAVDDFYAVEKSIDRIAFVSAEKSGVERIPGSLPSADEAYAELLEAIDLYSMFKDTRDMSRDENDRINLYGTEYALSLDYNSTEEFKAHINSFFAKEAEQDALWQCFEYYSDMHSARIPPFIDQDGKLYVVDDYYYYKNQGSSMNEKDSMTAGVFVDYEDDEKLVISVIKSDWVESRGGKYAIKEYNKNEYSYEYIDGAWKFTNY